MPAQMGGTGLPASAIAQEKERSASFYGAQAQSSAGGEIERLGIASDIGDDAGNSPAGERFFGHPEQVLHIRGPYQHELSGVKTERDKPRTIGNAEKLPVSGQLQVEHGHAPGRQQRSCLSQGKAEAGAAIAHGVGKNLLQQPTRQKGKPAFLCVKRPGSHLRQSRLALDIGNGFPQRGKALLAIGGLHGANRYMNKTGTW